METIKLNIKRDNSLTGGATTKLNWIGLLTFGNEGLI